MDGNTPKKSLGKKQYYNIQVEVNGILPPINSKVATGKSHLNTPWKIILHSSKNLNQTHTTSTSVTLMQYRELKSYIIRIA